MKRTFIALALILTLMLAACGGKAESSAAAVQTPALTPIPAPVNAEPAPTTVQSVYSCPPPAELQPAQGNRFEIFDKTTGEKVVTIVYDGKTLTISAIDGQTIEIPSPDGGYELLILIPHSSGNTIVVVAIWVSAFVCDGILHHIPASPPAPNGPSA